MKSLSLSIIVICLLGLAIYSNALYSPLQFDDISIIIKNPCIKDIRNLKAIWDYYPNRFISYLTLALNYHFDRGLVFGYHIFNLAAHIATSLLVFWLILLTFSTPAMKKEAITKHARLIAFFGALVFAAHPVQTQAVTYITQRMSSLAALFYIASLGFYAKSRLSQIENPVRRSWAAYYIASLIMCIAGMFTKEMVITLPAMVALYEFSFLKDKEKTEWRHVVPFLITLLIIPAVMAVSKTIDFSEMRRVIDMPIRISPYHYFLTELRVIVTYIRLLFIPVNQNIDYDYPIAQTMWNMPTLASLMLIALILTGGIMAFRRNRLISFSIFWFFLALLPESSFVPIRDVINEYRLYLPSVGYSIFIAAGIFYIFRHRSSRLAAAILTGVVIVYSILTYARNEVWNNGFTLWTDAIRKSPQKARPYYSRGLMYGYAGKYDDAISDFSRVIGISAAYRDAYNNRGLAYFYKGMFDQAISDFDNAISHTPGDAKIYNNRGLVYQAKGLYSQALADYDKALEIDPEMAEACFNKATVCEDTGRIEDAISAYKDYLSYTSRDDTEGITRARRAMEKLTR